MYLPREEKKKEKKMTMSVRGGICEIVGVNEVDTGEGEGGFKGEFVQDVFQGLMMGKELNLPRTVKEKVTLRMLSQLGSEPVQISL
jgi:hypothetical protein